MIAFIALRKALQNGSAIGLGMCIQSHFRNPLALAEQLSAVEVKVELAWIAGEGQARE